MDTFLGWALFSAINPTLLAAVTAMLMLPNPRRLLFGYLCGAWLTSISLGLLITFELQDSDNTINTAKHTVAPAVDLVVGGILLTVAYVVRAGRDTWRVTRAERRHEAQAGKPPPRWRRALDKGSARIAFVVGVCLTLPGLAYLLGMTAIADQDDSKPATVLAVVLFCVIMLMLIEIPLIGGLIAPEWADRMVERLSHFLRANVGRIAWWIAVVLGGVLVSRGVLTAAGVFG